MKIWLGPYLVDKFHENGSIQIRTIDGEVFPYLLMAIYGSCPRNLFPRKSLSIQPTKI